MPKIKNVSPFGDLFVPLLGIDFKHGSIVEVTDDEAKILLAQGDNFKAWGESAQKAKRRSDKEHEKVDGTAVAPVGEGDTE